MWKKLFAVLFSLLLLTPTALALDGADVSVFQGEIDFRAVRDSGVQAVYIRSSFGAEGVDDAFARNVRDAAQAGLPFGLYHFMEAETPDEARREANFFCQLIRSTGYTCRPALDFETGDGLSDEEQSDLVAAFLEEVEALTGQTPMLYVDLSRARRLDRGLARYPLWLAQWDALRPDLSGTPWTDWTGWQFTDRGRIPGIEGNVDLDRFTDGILLSPPLYFDYTVRRGDTLSALARRFGVTVADLAALNDISDPDRIYVGQRLRVPDPGGLTYTVRRGDTLSAIARRYGLSVSRLVSLNGISDPDLIFPGQVLELRGR